MGFDFSIISSLKAGSGLPERLSFIIAFKAILLPESEVLGD